MSRARELAELATGYDSGGSINFRNRIINGDMRISQRGAGPTGVNSETYVLDRWNSSAFGGPTCTVEQSTTAPAGFVNSLKYTVTTGATVDATDYSDVRQYIEGLNVADLGWGTANAQAVTLSFWVRSSVTGTFAVSFANSSYARNYPASYTINSADTWEYKTVTIPGDTTGTWLTNNGTGMRVVWDLGIGSTYSSTLNQWSSGVLFGGTGATKLAATTGATFYITGVQLEVGSVATPFERRPYGTELSLCQRYFVKLAEGTDQILPGTAFYYNATELDCPMSLPVAMRTGPTLVQTTGTNYYIMTNNSDYFDGFTTVQFASPSAAPTFINIYALSNISGTAGYAGYIRLTNASASVSLSAEL